MQPDGFFRRLVSPMTGTPRQYQFMARSYTLADSADVAALPTGSGIVDRSARWSATNTLAAGNMTDNGTKLQALLPWQFHNWTTAGRPTGVTGYTGYNTTTAFTEGYFTSQWENYITSIGASSGQVSYFTSAGKIAGNNNLFWDNSNIRLGIGTATPSYDIDAFKSTNALSLLRVGTSSNGSSANARVRVQASSDNNRFLEIMKFSSTIAAYKIISPSDGVLYNSGIIGDLAILNDFPTGRIKFATNGSSIAQMTLAASGNLLLGTTADVTGYLLNTVGTGAMSLPRGTVAQRPTIASSTTPLRYNTDSTALEYGESVGTWRQISTRAYARSLVAALPTTNIYTANGTLTSNRTITSGGFDLRYTGNMSIGSSSVPVRTLDVTGEVRISDLTTDTPTRIVGADADGDLGAMAISGGLSISSGTLSSTWLKPALEAGNVTVSNNSNTLTLTGSNFTMLNQGGFNNFTIAGNTDYEGTFTQSQKTFTYFTQLDRGNPLLPGHYRLKHQISQTSLGAGDHVINVTSLDTTAAVIRNFQGSFFGSETFAQQFTVNSNISSTTGFRILKNDSGTSGTLFDIVSTSGTSFSNSVRADGMVNWSRYGTGGMEAGDLSKTQSNYIAGFATDGTVLDLERKRDTTIYVTDADYNFSAAITSANILKRYNRIIIYSKLTSGSTSDNQIFLHTPSSDFLQCTIIIYSNDASADSDATSIDFTTNGAVDGAGGTLSSYAMAPGQRVEIRVADDGGYKWFFN